MVVYGIVCLVIIRRFPMKNLLKNITETTRLVWRENEEKIFKKYGEYRYRLVVNGLGVVEIIDLKAIITIASGNKAVQKKIKELAK
jgi:hypothetical protein